MKWFQRLSERVFRFAESREDIDWVAKWVGGTVSALALAMVFELVVALILK
ncbi:hypothetical protein P0D88_30375 [Paraburkholderia sp. RL18-103-BIB-C]|jgi:hypothetical protein|uniref:hypothetical protein n=1 Tax=unclassified Paraburkholderia TaxID=2615204 RepID=UPI0038B98069